MRVGTRPDGLRPVTFRRVKKLVEGEKGAGFAPLSLSLYLA